MKKVFLILGSRPQLALVGLFGMIQAIQQLMHYNAATDKSHGFSFWIYIVALALSAGYVILFVVLKFFVKDNLSPTGTQAANDNASSIRTKQ